MPTIKQLSDKGPDGTVLGQSATDLIGFYGMPNPIAQPANIAAITTTQAITTSFGFATTAQFNALINAVNSLISDQKLMGLRATA